MWSCVDFCDELFVSHLPIGLFATSWTQGPRCPSEAFWLLFWPCARCSSLWAAEGTPSRFRHEGEEFCMVVGVGQKPSKIWETTEDISMDRWVKTRILSGFFIVFVFSP